MIVETTQRSDRHESVSNQQGGPSEPSFGTLGPDGATDMTEATAPDAPAVGSPSQVPADESHQLDAYWASFGDEPTRALLRHPRARDAVREVILGKDDRVQVTATDQYPWRAIASLRITDQHGTGWIGTGWLVSPRLMLTAGHCVYLHNQGGWARQIEVIPGRNGDHWPFGSCIATEFRSIRGWTDDRGREYDYGAILLPEDCRYGDQLGWFGHQVRADAELAGVRVNLSGYPGDQPAGTQWFHDNHVSNVAERVLTYQVDTAGGQSGSPVWVNVPDRGRFGVAIHTNGHLSGNSGVRITSDVAGNIAAWQRQVP